tara:strand:+ start:1044 stop:1877 length:834 start_codon:yes stop_codon:yes gene_type:complete
MDFKKGFKIKPKEIRKNGIILFTDGTNEMMPNEETCLAYGYKFQDGICRAFIPSAVTERKESSRGVAQVGTNNISSSRNSQVIGESNQITESNNSLVSGESNVIDRGVNNSMVVGKMGRATHTNEFCIGGGGFNSEAGLLQYSVLQVSGKTTSGSNVDLYINGDDVIDKEITLPTNSVILYEVFLSALCTGGTRGTAGEYISYQWIGAVRSDNEGVMTNTITINRTLGSDGRGLGSQAISVTTPTIFRIRVSGQADVNAQWHAVVKLHINKTNAVEI